jgi:hypothetical protein
MRVMPSGRARISVRRPRAIGECDRCGFWKSLDDLRPQYQWGGNQLIDTGLLVCSDTCLDIPQQQFRSPILPPDPRPRVPSRPSPNTTFAGNIGGPLPTSPENQGLTQFVLEPSFFNEVNYPPTMGPVLAAIAAATGVATPTVPSLVSYVVKMTGATVSLVPPNNQRTFLAVYNPTQFTAQISLGNATQGAIQNMSIGPNEVYFSATAQGLGPAYVGALTAVGLFPGLPLWAWEAESNVIANLLNDVGVLQLTNNSLGYPTSPVGLSPGAVYDDNLAIGVVFGASPNPLAPPLFFGSVTAASLLAIGGGNLPITDPGNILQLWNNGGLVCVSLGGSVPAPPNLDFSKIINSQYFPLVL